VPKQLLSKKLLREKGKGAYLAVSEKSWLRIREKPGGEREGIHLSSIRGFSSLLERGFFLEGKEVSH